MFRYTNNSSFFTWPGFKVKQVSILVFRKRAVTGVKFPTGRYLRHCIVNDTATTPGIP
jgi:hypothetical protein